MGGQATGEAGATRIGLGKLGRNAAGGQFGAAVGVQGDKFQHGMLAGDRAALFDQSPGPGDGEGHIPAGRDVEADRAVGLFPAVTEVEEAEGLEFIDPGRGQVRLVHDQHLGPQLGLPGELGRIGHAAVIEDPGLEHEDQMPLRRGEVVQIAGARQAQDPGVDQGAVAVQVPDDGLVAAHADVPNRAVGGETGVGLERHALQVVAQGDELFRREGRGVHRQRRAAFPQGPDLVARDHDGGVGRAGVVGRANPGAGVAGRAEARGDDGVEFGLRAAFGRVGEAGRQGHRAVVHRERSHQPVPVEPVGGAAAGAAELARTVAEQGTLQPRRRPAVDQSHGARRDVAFEVGGGQGPGSGNLPGDRGTDPFGGGDGGGQGGGAHQEMTAGGGHVGLLDKGNRAQAAGDRVACVSPLQD